MPKDDRIFIRVSSKKKDGIRKRAESLDRSISDHMLHCYDQEKAISEGKSVVIPIDKLGKLIKEET